MQACAHGMEVEPFVMDADGGESAVRPRAWPMAAFANAEPFLTEVRLVMSAAADSV